MKDPNEVVRTEQAVDVSEPLPLKLKMKELKSRPRSSRAPWMPWSPT